MAIRHFSSCTAIGDGSNVHFQPGQWQFNTSYRYLKSHRHFRGDHEEVDRKVNNTEVVNNSHTLDLSLSFALNERLSFALSIPVIYNNRSSLYEHGLVLGEYVKQERHTSQSSGFGDSRISASYWLLDFEKNPYQNIALGLGLKIPTGDFKAGDDFYNVGPDGSMDFRPVDQSIQPGDGGWGITADVNAYKKLFGSLYLYANGFYLFNPRNTNGVRTFRETLVANILDNEAIMSVADQYLMRLGLSQSLNFLPGLSWSLGGRIEGVPVSDLFGKSEGFRRPGYAFSIEPGLNWMKGKTNFGVSIPLAVYRNRLQSLTDLESQRIYGIERHGDAAFADYLLIINYAYRF